MKTIHKYPFPISGSFALLMPAGAKPFRVDMQNGDPCLWAMVDTAATMYMHRFYVLGTGGPIPDDAGKYIGTFQQDPFVWHVFQWGHENP